MLKMTESQYSELVSDQMGIVRTVEQFSSYGEASNYACEQLDLGFTVSIRKL